MSKTGVIVCSNSGIDYVEHNYDIPVFRSVVVFSDEEKYDDYTEISAEAFYTRLKEDQKAFPHTAFCTMGKMIETYEVMKAKGYDSVLVIVISSNLSGLYNNVQLAGKEVEDFNVVAYDSKSVAYVQCVMAFTACEMFSKGASIEEVVEKLDYIRDNNHIILAVDTLEYLIKNGRLSKVSGTIASMLKIRPLLELNNEGKVVALDKPRTSKKARALMCDKFIEEIKGFEDEVIVYLLEGNAPKENIEECVNRVKAAYPQITNIPVYPVTPVVGAHAGPGVVALGWIKK